MIQAGTASQTQTMPVARLSEDQLLRLVLPVPESVVPRIHVGEPVTVNVHSLNRGYEGRVARFSGKIDLATRTMETEIDVPNRGFVLKPGMYAEAALTLDRRADALAVPVQALSVNGQSTAVFLVTLESKIEERPVTLGIETPNKVEILSGIKENDLVVVGSRSQLKAGQRVEPKVVDPAFFSGAE